MAMTNHERVGRALTLVRDAVRTAAESAWQTVFGDRWLQSVNERLYHPDNRPSTDDLAFLLKGMEATWNEIFRKVFSRSTRSYLHLLRDDRNAWAHNERFGSDETVRILDHCEMVLQDFRAAEAAAEAAELKRSLQRQVYDQERRNVERRAGAEATKGEPLAGLKPWREVAVPHRDVREGRFAQAEFAANLRQVVEGEAAEEYGDPRSFFERTFITEGLRDLIRTAARRLSGEGGDPVVELQTGFGGGKTHSLIALYHLASDAAGLPGVDEALAEDGLSVPRGVNRAVFTGQWAAPGSPRRAEGLEINTMWGDIAYQLGGVEGYRLVEDDDRRATNPGAKLIELFRRCGPVLILIDEWVAYARELPMGIGEKRLPAGDFDTQFTFAQALTEAADAVDDALLVVAVPDSEDPEGDSLEVGGEKGRHALDRLRHALGRLASQWRPASSEESFEIVRRRLFEPVDPRMAPHRDAVVKAYHRLYRDNPGEFPSETREGDYLRRLEAAYPIHPELFERLYQDWSTLERFQRTRGVLRLMASVISELWDRDDSSLMIMPGFVPMDSSKVVPELTRYLADRWKPIIDADVDGPGSLPQRSDRERPNLGRYWACRRAARTVYLGSAALPAERRGIDRTRIVLGCVQPGEQTGVFKDALGYLAEDATYLYNRSARFWYDTKPSLTRLAADRALSRFDDYEVDSEIRRLIQKQRVVEPLDGVHPFPDGPGDVPDDDTAVRLVILSPDGYYERGGESPAVKAARGILDQRSGGPRINRNMLVFLAADKSRVPELRQAMRARMAWESILDEKGEHDLNLTPADVRQAETRLAAARETVDLRIGETFCQILNPVQNPGEPDIEWTAVRVAGAGGLAERAVRKLESSEHLIPAYSGIRVRGDLDRVPLWDGDSIGVVDLWAYYCRYLYMPRLAGFGVLSAAVADGAASMNWQNETFAYAEGYDPESDRYLGLKAGEQSAVTRSREAVLVRSERASVQVDAEARPAEVGEEGPPGFEESGRRGAAGPHRPRGAPDAEAPLYTRFYGRINLDPVRGIRDLSNIMEAVTPHLIRAGEKLTLTLEINAESEGYDDRTRRTVKENAAQLGFDLHEFEE